MVPKDKFAGIVADIAEMSYDFVKSQNLSITPSTASVVSGVDGKIFAMETLTDALVFHVFAVLEGWPEDKAERVAEQETQKLDDDMEFRVKLIQDTLVMELSSYVETGVNITIQTKYMLDLMNYVLKKYM